MCQLLRQLNHDIATCTACPNMVPHRQFQRGDPAIVETKLMMIGEAPGRVSLDNGVPFSNPGNLTIRNALRRVGHAQYRELEDLFYLTDVVKCHPTNNGNKNRAPRASEVHECSSRFVGRELGVVRPRAVLTFGRLASQVIAGESLSMVDAHGRWREARRGFRHLPLLHPSGLNRANLMKVGLPDQETYEVFLAKVFAELIDEFTP